LFSTQSDENIKTEIVLSITPRLIRNVQRHEAGLMEFEAGTDASLRARSVEGTAPSAPAPPAAPRVEGSSTGASPATSPATPSAAQPYASAPSDSSIGAPPAPAPVAPPPISEAPSAPGAIGPSVTPGGLGAAPAQLTWIAPAVVKVGENFAVQLQIQSEQPIGSVSATIGFEPALVQVVSVVEGDFMQRGGAQSTLSSRTDASGQLLFTLARPAAVNGQGSLITVNLRANASTEQTSLQLLNANAVGAEGRSVALAPLSLQLLRITP
jgi:general secretion pathway protein D